MVVLVAAHAALFGFAFQSHLPVALGAGLVGLLVLKYVWWRFRR
jgi:hypothetical protein